MWYLEQLQEYLNEKFINNVSPSRVKINDRSNSKSLARTSEYTPIDPMDSKAKIKMAHHRSQNKFDVQVNSAMS